MLSFAACFFLFVVAACCLLLLLLLPLYQVLRSAPSLHQIPRFTSVHVSQRGLAGPHDLHKAECYCEEGVSLLFLRLCNLCLKSLSLTIPLHNHTARGHRAHLMFTTSLMPWALWLVRLGKHPQYSGHKTRKVKQRRASNAT